MDISDAIRDRALAKIIVGPDCWEWDGQHIKGYGSFTFRRAERPDHGTTMAAHKMIYQIVKGRVPAGLELDHLCRNRGCVNPSHLQPVTHRVNNLRGDTFTARQFMQSHCLNGHALTGDNVYKAPGRNNRWCKQCRRDYMREYYRKRRAA